MATTKFLQAVGGMGGMGAVRRAVRGRHVSGSGVPRAAFRPKGCSTKERTQAARSVATSVQTRFEKRIRSKAFTFCTAGTTLARINVWPRFAALSLACFWLALAGCQATAAPTVVLCGAGQDVTEALRAALRPEGPEVILRAVPNGATCSLSRSLMIPRGLNLAGQGHPVLRLSETGNAFRGDQRSRNFSISGIAIDGSDAPKASAIALRGSSDGRLARLRLIRPGDGIVLAEGSHDIAICDLEVVESRQHGVTIRDSRGNAVNGARLDGQRGFGVVLVGTSHDNRLDRLSTRRSGLELVGMTVGTHNNTLENSSANNTGDNCYSITGSNNRLRNLTGDRCAGSGITLYGSRNTLEGGRFTNNAQRHDVRPAWAGGVSFIQGFGGVAQGNTVRDVTVDDDQPRPTQQVGVLTTAAGYQAWRPGVAVRTGHYTHSGLSLYVSRSSGVTGTRPPFGPGRVSDGAVVWELVNSFEGTLQPDGNTVENVQIGRAARAPREDHSASQHNIGTR
ncbi:hypothetical protein GCM10009416_45710 [Craurococcus roseus]|uniref:Periplasmic copper-binding protein NosD beta helix domain-containing protein n=1 Tax=Craurococcus roseus TaxID=77585 RepID=A0ABN1G2F0_9PROT